MTQENINLQIEMIMELENIIKEGGKFFDNKFLTWMFHKNHSITLTNICYDISGMATRDTNEDEILKNRKRLYNVHFKQRATTFKHPLRSSVYDYFIDTGNIYVDVLELSRFLGSPSKPTIGRKAYKTVAADILITMSKSCLIVRHGSVRGGKPEDGGHWYSLELSADFFAHLAKRRIA